MKNSQSPGLPTLLLADQGSKAVAYKKKSVGTIFFLGRSGRRGCGKPWGVSGDNSKSFLFYWSRPLY